MSVHCAKCNSCLLNPVITFLVDVTTENKAGSLTHVKSEVSVPLHHTVGSLKEMLVQLVGKSDLDDLRMVSNRAEERFDPYLFKLPLDTPLTKFSFKGPVGYSIRGDLLMPVVKPDKNSRTVVVKTLTGKTMHIRCNHVDSIDTLKCRLSDQEGIPPDQQRIVYAGRQMEGDTRLMTLPSDATFHLILSMRGGMYHTSSGKDGEENLLGQIWTCDACLDKICSNVDPSSLSAIGKELALARLQAKLKKQGETPDC